MASLIGNPLGKVAQGVTELEQGRIFQSPLNKVWRALILINRATSIKPKAEAKKLGKKYDAENQHIAQKGSFSNAQKKDPWYRNKIDSFITGITPEEILESNSYDYTLDNYNLVKKLTAELIKNDIVIANLDVSPAISLVIQNRPNSLRVEPTSTWAAVKSMGRNNPFYFYTSGEDTLSFEISWYSTDIDNRDDVVNKCRLLESWSRSNGYEASPPTLRIQWGNSDLFEDDLFILTAAPYELTHFQNAARMSSRYNHDEDTGKRISNLISRSKDIKLLPNCATQTLTFKRVTKNNRTWEEIIPNGKLSRTPGVKVNNNINNIGTGAGDQMIQNIRDSLLQVEASNIDRM